MYNFSMLEKGSNERKVYLNKETGSVTVVKDGSGMVINTPDSKLLHVTAEGLDFLKSKGITLKDIKEDLDAIKKAKEKPLLGG